MLTNDLRVMSLCSCELGSKFLNSFKGVLANISVAEIDSLVSGSYYNGRGASDIDALKTRKST